MPHTPLEWRGAGLGAHTLQTSAWPRQPLCALFVPITHLTHAMSVSLGPSLAGAGRCLDSLAGSIKDSASFSLSLADVRPSVRPSAGF